MNPKNLKNFSVTKNGPGFNKNNKNFESAMLDIHDGIHSTNVFQSKLYLKKSIPPMLKARSSGRRRINLLNL